MRKIILAALFLIVAGGTAMADRHHGRDHQRNGGWDRDRNARRTHVVRNQPTYRRQHYNDYRWRDRRPVYASSNRFVFANGYTRYYNRPVIRHRYTDYRYRPSLIVENYDPVEGYIWVPGNWSWDGYQWNWVGGHYEVDVNYGYPY